MNNRDKQRSLAQLRKHQWTYTVGESARESRNGLIVAALDQGITKHEIGEALGFSPETVLRIASRERARHE